MDNLLRAISMLPDIYRWLLPMTMAIFVIIICSRARGGFWSHAVGILFGSVIGWGLCQVLANLHWMP